MRKGKNTVVSVVLSLLIVLLGTCSLNFQVGAASKAEQAKTAYKKFLKNVSDTGKLGELTVSEEQVEFYMKDVTGDKVPELFINQTMTMPSEQSVYTFYKGKVKCLKTMNWYAGGEVRKIYPKKHVIEAVESEDDGGTGIYYYKVSANKMTLAAVVEGPMDKYGNVKYRLCKIQGKVVSKKKFQSYVSALKNSGVIPILGETSTKYHTNTKKHRDKYLK